MSFTEGQIQEMQGEGTRKVFEVRGFASFPFIITVEAGDEEDAAAIAEGIELTDLLVDRDDEGFDEVLVEEVSLLTEQKASE